MVPIGRKNSRSRSLRFVVAAATAVLQLHLFFVTDLHNHNLEQIPVGGQSQISLRQGYWQSATAPDPLCSACRISHQGAVQVTAATPLDSDDYRSGRVTATHVLKFDPQFLSHPSSRAPPLY